MAFVAVARRSARTRATTRSTRVSGGEHARARRPDIDVLFTPGPQPGPRDLRAPRARRALLRRRAVPGLGRPHRPARRRPRRRCSRRSPRCSTRFPRRDGRAPRPHGPDDARRASARPTRSSPSSPGEPGESSRRRAARTTCCPSRRRGAPALERAARRDARGRRLPARSRRRSSRRPSCSPAASASRPTSSRRRCTRFEDGGERSLTLRPEGTAPICRAYLEHGMHKLPQPVKLWYLRAVLPLRAPQAGRYRQFWQIGAEAIGSDDPAVDAESIVLLRRAPRRARGRATCGCGSASSARRRRRAAYREELAGPPARARGPALRRGPRAHRPQPAARVRRRPPGHAGGHGSARRCCSTTSTPRTPSTSPRSARCSTPPAWTYEIDPTLVRGLDYYTRTVFEFTSDALGAQSGVGGGGRYDGLIELLGGPPTPGCGWAAGVERILLAGGRAADAPAARRPLRRRARRARRARGVRARRRGAPRRARRAARARRPLAEGPAQAGRPARRPVRCDRRRTTPRCSRTWTAAEQQRDRRRPRSSPACCSGRHSA